MLDPAGDGLGGLVRWADVAAATGRRIQPEVRWDPLLTGPLGTAPKGLVSLWVSRTAERHVSENLKRVLFGDDPPVSCWMAVWAGHGGLTDSFDAPLIYNVIRECVLFQTPAEAVNEWLRPFGGPLPGLWWPEDRSYFVGTDTDICWTYVGGSHDLIERLLDDSESEVLEVDAKHRGDTMGDTINGAVRPTWRQLGWRGRPGRTGSALA